MVDTAISRVRTHAAAATTAAVAWPLAAGAICFSLLVVRLQLIVPRYLDLVGGRLVAQHGIPRSNTLTLVAHGHIWVDQQWLGQLAMYATWRAAGDVGLGFLFAVSIGLAYALLAHLCARLGAPPVRAAQWALIAFLGSVGYTSIRAEMFSFPAFVLTVSLLVKDAERREFGRSSLWVIGLLALWANVHGDVVLGVLPASAYFAVRAVTERRQGRRRSSLLYGLSSAASVATLLATPYGFAVLGYYRTVFSSSILRAHENEWTAPRLTYPFDWMTYLLLAVTVVTIGLALRRRQRPNAVLLLATVVTGPFAFHAIRFQPWFAVSASSLAAVTLQRLLPAPRPLSRRFLRLGAAGLAFVTLICAVAAVRAPANRHETALARGAVAAAARWTTAHPGSAILADEDTSDRLLWLQPQTIGRVGLDGRLELYDAASQRTWFGFIFGSAIPRSIGATRYDVFVASNEAGGLYRKLKQAPCLRTIYVDADGIAAVSDPSRDACPSGTRS